MKRLLTLLPAALIPLFVYSCGGFHTKPAEVVKEVVEQLDDTAAERLKEGFEALPRTIPLTKPDVAPVLPSYKPKEKPRAHVGAPRRPPVHAPVRPLPRPRPIAPQASVEESEAPLPPQHGVICIFPFWLVPHCTPEPAGRLP